MAGRKYDKNCPDRQYFAGGPEIQAGLNFQCLIIFKAGFSMTLPKPGKPVRSSSTGRPIMVLLDLLSRKWTLRILWELKDGALTFRALQTKCDGMSPTVLNRRLTELRESDIVGRGDGGYQLTMEGGNLLKELGDLNTWSNRWAKRLDQKQAGESKS